MANFFEEKYGKSDLLPADKKSESNNFFEAKYGTTSPSGAQQDPQPGQEDKGFLGNAFTVAKQGAERLYEGASVVDDVLTGEIDDDTPDLLAQQLSRKDFRPKELEDLQNKVMEYGASWDEAKGFAESAAVVGNSLLALAKNPLDNAEGAAYLIAEQLPNMIPSTAGMVAGSLAGSVVPGVGNVIGGILGGFAGGAATEAALEMAGYVGDKLSENGLDPTPENIRTLLADEETRNEIINQTRRKAAVTGAVDAVFTKAGGMIATAPQRLARRAARRAAVAELGQGAAEAQIARRAGELFVEPGFRKTVAAAAGGTVTDIFGEGASEAAGQYAATGEVNTGDVLLETLAGGVASAVTELPGAVLSSRETFSKITQAKTDQVTKTSETVIDDLRQGTGTEPISSPDPIGPEADELLSPIDEEISDLDARINRLSNLKGKARSPQAEQKLAEHQQRRAELEAQRQAELAVPDVEDDAAMMGRGFKVTTRTQDSNGQTMTRYTNDTTGESVVYRNGQLEQMVDGAQTQQTPTGGAQQSQRPVQNIQKDAIMNASLDDLINSGMEVDNANLAATEEFREAGGRPHEGFTPLLPVDVFTEAGPGGDNTRAVRSGDGAVQTDISLAQQLGQFLGKRVIFGATPGDLLINGFTSPNQPNNIYVDIRTPVKANVVFGHELSHQIDQTAPDLFNKAFEAMTPLMQNLDVYRQRYDGNPSDDFIRREIFGDVLGDNFDNKDFWSQVKARMGDSDFAKFAGKIIDVLDNLIGKFKGEETLGSERFITDMKKARKILAEMTADYAKGQQKKTGANNQTSTAQASTTDVAFSTVGKNDVTEQFDDVAGAPSQVLYSRHEFPTQKKRIVAHFKEKLGVTDKKAVEFVEAYFNNMGDDYQAYIDQIDAHIKKYPEMGTTQLPKNSDPTYAVTVDLVSACIRMLRALPVHKYVESKGLNLTSFQMRALEAELNKSGFDLTCIYCYAFTRRANAIAKKEWMFDHLVRGVMPKTENNGTTAVTAEKKKLWEKALAEAEANPGWEAEYAALPDLVAIKAPADDKTLEKVSPAAVEFKKKYPAIHELKQVATDAGNLKMPTGTLAIAGQIINLTDEMVSHLHNWGGLRWQSSVDFMPMMAYDYIQGVIEMALRQVSGHTYTKEVDLPLLLGNSGFKVNLSAAPMIRNGKVVWETDPDGNRRPKLDTSVGSMTWDDIETAMVAGPDHIGVMMLGTNDEVLDWATDPGSKYAPFVIPWHASGMPAPISQAFKATDLQGAIDYTDPHESLTVYQNKEDIPERFRSIAIQVVDKKGRKVVKKKATKKKPASKTSNGWTINFARLGEIDPALKELAKEYISQRDEHRSLSAVHKNATLLSFNIPTGFIIDQVKGVDDVAATKQYFAMIDSFDGGLKPLFEEYRQRFEEKTGKRHGDRYWVLKKHYARTDTPLLPPDPKQLNFDHARKLDDEWVNSELAKEISEGESSVIDAAKNSTLTDEQRAAIDAGLDVVLSNETDPLRPVLKGMGIKASTREMSAEQRKKLAWLEKRGTMSQEAVENNRAAQTQDARYEDFVRQQETQPSTNPAESPQEGAARASRARRKNLFEHPEDGELAQELGSTASDALAFGADEAALQKVILDEVRKYVSKNPKSKAAAGRILKQQSATKLGQEYDLWMSEKVDVKSSTRTVDNQTVSDNNENYAYRETATESDRVQGQKLLDERRRTDRSKPSLLGNAITKRLASKGGTSLIGNTISSPLDLAALAQVYRNPSYETFRIFLTKNGEVVGQSAISSRLPGVSYIFEGEATRENTDAGFENLRSQMEELEADGYWLLHNHPSGDVVGSQDDANMTFQFQQNVPGFQGHVIINHNKYALMSFQDGDLTGETRQEVFSEKDDLLSPSVPNNILGRRVSMPDHLAEIGAELQLEDGIFSLISHNKAGVRGVLEVPESLLDNLTRMAAVVRSFARQTGAQDVFAVVPNNMKDKMYGVGSRAVREGYLRDVVSMDGFSTGEMRSPDLFFGRAITGRRVAEDGVGQLSLPITEEMRDDIMTKGQALFSQRPIGGVGPAPSVYRNAPPYVRNTIDYLRMKFQDKFIPLIRAQELLQSQGWNKRTDNDAYRAEEVFHGKTQKRLEDLYNDLIHPLMKKIYNSSVTIEELEDYLYAKFAPERNAHIASINDDMPDGGSGMTNQEAQDILDRFDAEGKTQELEALAQEVRTVNQLQRDIIRNEGLESEDLIDAWELNAPNYIPLKGGKEERSQGIGTGFNIKKSGTKRALGRTTRATDLLANLFADTGTVIVRAEKAKVGRAFLKMAEENPNSTLFTVHDKLPRRRTIVNGKVGYTNDFSFPQQENVLTVTQNDGSIKYVEIFDEDLARVMKNLTPTMGRATRAMATITRWLSMVSTSLNPEFVITNFERDIQTAMIHLAGEQDAKLAKDVLKSVPSAMRGIRNALRGDKTHEMAQWYERYQNAGGQVSFMDLRGVEDWQRKLVDEARGGAFPKTKKATKAVFDAIGDYNTVVENAVRLSAFRKAIEAGMSESDAASLAKNLTVNFNRKGEMGPAINALYMFANAGIQGSARIAASMVKSKRVRRMMAATTLMAWGLAELNRLNAGEDDDDRNRWDKVSDYQKDVNLIWVNDDGSTFKIRVPYGYSTFVRLGYSMSDLFHYYKGDGGKPPEEVTKDLVSAFMNSFNPLGGDQNLLSQMAPTIADPLVDIALNENFMGENVRPENLPFGPQKPDSELYYRSASEVSKAIASTLNEITGGTKWKPGMIDVSPESLDHVFEFVIGGLGRTVLRTVDLPAKAASGDLTPNQIPFLRQIYNEPTPYVDIEAMYDSMSEVDSARAALKEIPLSQRSQFAKENPQARLWKRVAATRKLMSNLRKARYAALDRGDNAEARRIQERMHKVAKAFNKVYDKATK